MEPTTAKSKEKDPQEAPEDNSALSVNDLDKIAGGRADNDPCEGGQFHSK